MAMTGFATRNQAGFSLIETMVALALLVVGLAAATKGFVEAQRVAIEVAQRERAISLAHDKLTERLGRPYADVATPTDAAERVVDEGMLGQDDVSGISRTWVVQTGYPIRGLARVWVATRWVRRGEIQSYQTAGLLAEGLSP
jgi:prepilin-type N-terminal cleavage/methylation domain-containing protein